MKKHKYDARTRIKIKDLAEGSLLVDTRERIWVVEDVVGHRLTLHIWGRNNYTKVINIGSKGWLYGFYLY